MLNKIVMTLLLFTLTSGLHAAPRAEAWSHWNQSQATRSFEIDHEPWQQFLDRYLVVSGDGINRVKYAAVTKHDREMLGNYLKYLQRLPVRQMTRDQQLAYWINLYNAGTVSVILDHYPVASILDIDISPGLFSNGPWGKKLFTIDAQAVSLDDIEHRILRPLWRDPRIHYAVNCASLGCPNLQTTAFTEINAEELLNHAADIFINHQRGVRIDRDRLVVSSIYHWFKVDFGKNDAAIIEHLRQYAKAPLLKQLQNIAQIDDHDYDWSLNRDESR
ncbi:MAG: DUF547 domain-containing protein [Candidatus Thiodiazotropha sp. (ex Monitilora ramsayi)]|nr:DUF547 domain-containing protein [Candidatus Thiodiazotropha sp. (ex Monitilora ramsayi)]